MDVKDTYSIDYLIGKKDYLGKGLGKSIHQVFSRILWQNIYITVASIYKEDYFNRENNIKISNVQK